MASVWRIAYAAQMTMRIRVGHGVVLSTDCGTTESRIRDVEKGHALPQDVDFIARPPQELIGDLNEQQAQAVQYRGPALLIGAGAGSGKTRVLTRRIAWILTQFGAWPSQVLAITFTNKAATEMRERLGALIGGVADRMWVSTFHSACVRILRRDGEQIGLKSGFTIYDTADCERLIKLICADFNIDIKRFTPRSILARISDYKNQLTDASAALAQYAPDFKPGMRHYSFGQIGNPEPVYAVVYAEYQYRLALANAVDFDDLIVRTVELLRTQPHVAEYYRHKFRYILVDEYQDTNHAQYVLVRELAGVDAHEPSDPTATGAGKSGPAWVTVVGDSDQSIYAFRGADIRNIQDFEKDFPDARTIMLEQNYRSTQTILDAANAVIAHNSARKPKKLWTALGEGDKIIGYAADTAQLEAHWITQQILHLHEEKGLPYSDMAIMYRANAQSRSLEEGLIQAHIPYQLIGGTKFYERREVKDAIAYLQAIVNPADDINMRRILNVPKRGLGARAESQLTLFANEHSQTFWWAIEHLEDIEDMSARTANAVRAFRELMTSLRAFAGEHDSKPSEIVAQVLEQSHMLELLRKSEDPQDESRVENLSQLQSVAAEFEQNTPDTTLAGFLETTALVADSDQLPGEGHDSGKVTLMTLHTAKGLEYPIVFLTGMEQGTFPHSRAMENMDELSEERRLAYVGITRAKRRLYLTRAAVRAQWGRQSEMMPSQFLDEIPDSLIDWKRREAGMERMRSGWRNDGFDDGFSDEFGGWDDGDSDYGAGAYGRSSYGSSGRSRTSSGSDFGSHAYGSSGTASNAVAAGTGWGSAATFKSSSGHSAYGSESYSSGRSRGSGSSTGAYGARWSHGGSSSSRSSASRSGAVHTRHTTAKAPQSQGMPISQIATDNNLDIADLHVGDRITHDRFGLGKVVQTQDKGKNSVITVDFGSTGVKRLMLRLAPIEKL